MILILGVAALGLLSAWLVGGILLRATGATLAVAGLLGLFAFGQAGGLLVAGIGTAMWLGGHWHYALRRQEYKSALARHIFCRWAPGWLDPTRRWVVSVDVPPSGAAGEGDP
jgi:hypothetical protein